MRGVRSVSLVSGLMIAAIMYFAMLPAIHAGGPAQAQAALADMLGIDASRVRVVRVEFVDWTDGCMGLRASGESCGGRLAEIPQGNVTWVAFGDDAYRYHGSERSRALRLAAGPFPADQVTSAPLPEGARLRPIESDDRAALERVVGLPATGSGGLADTGDDRAPSAVGVGVAAAGVLLLLSVGTHWVLRRR